MGSADATRRVPWLRYALFGILIAALWLTISLLSNAVGASAEENDPAASDVVPALGADPAPTTTPRAAAPKVDAPPGPADTANHASAAPVADHPTSVESPDAGQPADAAQNSAPGSAAAPVPVPAPASSVSVPVAKNDPAPAPADKPDHPTAPAAQPAIERRIERPATGNPADTVQDPARAPAIPAAPKGHPATGTGDKPDHPMAQPATVQPPTGQPAIERPTGQPPIVQPPTGQPAIEQPAIEQPETGNPAEVVLENQPRDTLPPDPAPAVGPPVAPSLVTDGAPLGRGVSGPPSGMNIFAEGAAWATDSNTFDPASTPGHATGSITPAGGATLGGAPSDGSGNAAPSSGGGAASGGAGSGGAGSGGAGSGGAGASGTSDATLAAQELGALAALALNSTDDELPSSPVFGTDTTPD